VKKNFWRRKGKCILPSRQKGEKVHEGGCHGLHIASISPFTDYFYQYAKSFSSFSPQRSRTLFISPIKNVNPRTKIWSWSLGFKFGKFYFTSLTGEEGYEYMFEGE
jgi:hypothetical protein